MRHIRLFLTTLFLISLLVMTGCIGVEEPAPLPDAGEDVAEQTPAEETVQEDTSVDDTAEETADSISLTELPSLPPIQGGAAPAGGMMGLGGGGKSPEGEAAPATMPVDPAIGFIDVFSGTNFVLNASLPAEPATAEVRRLVYESYDLEEARRLAEAFGFSGPLYSPVYPTFPDGALEGEAAMPLPEAPPAFVAFDGTRTLHIQGSGTFYMDQSISFQGGVPLVEGAVPVAEAFLQERGLLDFPYVGREYGFGSVGFIRTINGRPLNVPEINVQVTPDHRIFTTSIRTLTTEEIMGDYPLRSAEAAWQLLQEGVMDNNISYIYVPDLEQEQRRWEQDTEMPDVEMPKFWERRFQPGEEADLYTVPQVYQPAAGEGAPYILLERYHLVGDESQLRAIADAMGQGRIIHVRGTMADDDRTLELAQWEALDNEAARFLEGVARREGQQVLLETENEGTFLIAAAPDDLPDGMEIQLSAWEASTSDQGYPLLSWQYINERMDFPMPEAVEEPLPPADGPPQPPIYEQITINDVVLSYYSMPDLQEAEATTQLSMWEMPALLQPVWQFTGETDSGEKLQFFVPAVAPEYLETPAG